MKATDTLATLASFDGTNGQAPSAGLIVDIRRQSLRYDIGGRARRFWHGVRTAQRQRDDHNAGFIWSWGGISAKQPGHRHAGNLYAVTTGAAAQADGGIFELPSSPNSDAETVIVAGAPFLVLRQRKRECKRILAV